MTSMTSMTPGRVVVTGHTQDESSVIVADHRLNPVQLADHGVLAHFLWGCDDSPTYPDNGGGKPRADGFPPPGGYRVSTLTIPAGANEAYRGFIRNALGNLADSERPGFHRTPTLDVVIVLHGSPKLETDGQATVLGPGDVVVQNGTSHRWTNGGDTDVVLASVVLGARLNTPDVEI